MKRSLPAVLIFGMSVLLTPESLHAQEAKGADPDLPQPFDASALQAMVHNPPFNRVVDFAESYLLTGIAHVEGKVMATLMHRETKKRFVVSDEPNSQGWRLAEVTGDSELKNAQIKLVVGPEVVTLRYDAVANTPTPATRGPSRYGPSSGPRPDIHSLTDADVIRKDENGKEYVRGSSYLTDAQYERYRNGLSREAHDKYREVIRDNRDRMFKYNADQRADFSRKVFEKIEAEDKARQGK